MKTVQEVENLILEKSKVYGSRNLFLASEEYKRIYPEIVKIYAENKQNFIERIQREVEDSNLKIGDRVKTFMHGFAGSTLAFGTLVKRNGGIPTVKLDHHQMTNRGIKKQVTFSSIWKLA